MESPATRNANVFLVGLNPIVSMSTVTQPSACCSRLSAKLAGIQPNNGMSLMRLRSFVSGDLTRNDRALPGSDWSLLCINSRYSKWLTKWLTDQVGTGVNNSDRIRLNSL
jgi:hypothetical protein